MRKFIYLFLSAFLVISSVSTSYANTSVGGWSLADSVMSGATATVNATKTAGGIALESSAKVAASAAKVGTKLIRGGGTAALLMAVPQILGEGVDWVLDPANNAIRYTPDNPADTANPGYICSYNDGFSTAQAAGVAICEEYSNGVLIGWSKGAGNKPNGSPPSPRQRLGYPVCGKGGGYGSVYAQCVVDPSYDPDVPDYEYIPINEVAVKVISNAEAGHGPSQDVVEAVALEGFAAGELDPALNAAANVAGANPADTSNPPDTANPPDVSDPPAVPDPIDYTSVLNNIKALLSGILGSISGISDFLTAEPQEDPNADGDIPIIPADETMHEGILERLYISMPSQCPSDPVLEFMGASIPFPMSTFCQFASMMKPLILLFAYIKGLSIIGNGLS